ncbi:nucleotidyltransferase family protein [Mesobacterium pallidum]|uniref:nucleotidyltransferase family protein n=1 Tax=Mesobacterium pallidum TaxID=2872037 RepID=UPI001EE172F5|nr:nucleotidyltransferase family protein [Mesobacterium pallidum]
MPDTVMLFAAGFGTRMGALTADRPKPLIPVAGQPLLDHALRLTDQPFITRRVVNAHYHADQIERHLAGRDVAVSTERPEILDTGGGLRAALPLTGPGPLFTMNTDTVFDGPNPLGWLRDAWQPDRMDALLILIDPARALGRKGAGDFDLDGQRLKRGTQWIYGGIQILKTDGLAAIPDRAFSLNRLWDQMASRGRLCGLPYPGRWCDVGHPEGIALAESLLRGADVQD